MTSFDIRLCSTYDLMWPDFVYCDMMRMYCDIVVVAIVYVIMCYLWLSSFMSLFQ
jgi:hypothetical protein